MRSAVAFAVVWSGVLVAACGSDRQLAARPVPAPAGIPVAVAIDAALARHAGPTCPIARPPAPAAAPEDPDLAEYVSRSRIAKPAHAGDRCEIADTNLARAEDAILAAKHGGTPTAVTAWDHKRTPDRMALVAKRLALQPDETKRLAANGFVVLDRHTFHSYAMALHEIYQSQLPIYISVDAILHAVYAGNDSFLAALEDGKLAPKLGQILDALACALPTAADVLDETRRDLDVYLAVARALYSGAAPVSMLGDPAVEAEARALVADAIAAQEMHPVTLFGRARVVDFTAYTPRGHYTADETRQRYFRAAMWLSRVEFNLVSRSSRSSQPGDVPDPTETPREDLDALALAQLVDHANVGADVAVLDAAWALLAGKREDVTVAQLSALRTSAGIAKLTDPDAAAKLRTAIGAKFPRTARLHYMPQGSTNLPAIATLLGPRVVPDAAATRPLVNDEIPGRTVLHAADMGYALGHDRALVHLASERSAFPTLEAQLKKARAIVNSTPRGTDDLYSAWMDGVVALASPSAGARPSFMATDAYADLRLDSALVAFGHLKHNFVLVVGESYFAGGCEIPDGYVEPAPATYDALIEYAARGERSLAAIDPKDEIGGRAYFKRLAHILAVLRAIQDDELANRPLSADEKNFLSMVVEMTPGTTGSPATFTGWWFDLFRDREQDGLAAADYIASFFTGEKIAYVGAVAPRLGVFVVDTGGAPRVVVGPVARAYEYEGPQAHRLDDAAARDLPAADRAEPWAASYAIAAVPEPAFHVDWTPGTEIRIETTAELGTVTFEALDHHRRPIASVTKVINAGKTAVSFPKGKASRAEGLHVHVATFDAWLEISLMEGSVWGEFGGFHSTE